MKEKHCDKTWIAKIENLIPIARLQRTSVVINVQTFPTWEEAFAQAVDHLLTSVISKFQSKTLYYWSPGPSLGFAFSDSLWKVQYKDTSLYNTTHFKSFNVTSSRYAPLHSPSLCSTALFILKVKQV